MKSNLTRYIDMITHWDLYFLPVFEGIAAFLSVLYCSLCEKQTSMLNKKHLILRCIQITWKSAVVLNLEWATIGNPSTWCDSRSKHWLLFMSSYGPHFVWDSLFFINCTIQNCPFGHACSNNYWKKRGPSTYMCIQF